MISLLHTLLQLGHSTSQNLEFAHIPNVKISYGEETITETNLLEIRRRHPHRVTLFTFSKSQESKKTGADWEWHIIGSFYTLKMRVQAKRVHKAGGIGNLKQMGKEATKPQIDLLIDDARNNRLFAAYCFYCSEPQRSIWVKSPVHIDYVDRDNEAFESGCLIADAEVVQSKAPKKLSEIEGDTVPWHFLCVSRRFLTNRSPYLQRYLEIHRIERYIERYVEEIIPSYDDRAADIGLPTVFQLNNGRSGLDGRKGIFRTPEALGEDIIPEEFERRGVARLLMIDMREPDLFAIRG